MRRDFLIFQIIIISCLFVSLTYSIAQQCHWTCATCGIGTTADNQCLTCNSDYTTTIALPNSLRYFSSGSCLVCGEYKYVASASTCGDCHVDCRRPGFTCSGPTIPECVKCQILCTTCYGPMNYQCLTCQSGLHLDYLSNRCRSECDARQFINSNNRCWPCHASCLTCGGTESTNCLTCDTGSANKYFHQSQCLTACPANMYSNSNTCTPCNSKCNCEGTDPCTTCQSTYVKLATSCGCPADGFFDSGSGCTACPNYCVTCSSSTACSVCKNDGDGIPYFKQPSENTCSTSCPTGYYKNLAANNNQCSTCPQYTYLNADQSGCTNCDGNCASCSGSASNCHSCKGATSYKQPAAETCSTTCPGHYYPTGNNCGVCHASCENCNGPNIDQCTSCISSKHLGGNFTHSNLCLDHCNWGLEAPGTCENCNFCASCTVANSVDGCYQCYENCNACFGFRNKQCTACKFGFYLYHNTSDSDVGGGFYCVPSCPVHTSISHKDSRHYCELPLNSQGYSACNKPFTDSYWPLLTRNYFSNHLYTDTWNSTCVNCQGTYYQPRQQMCVSQCDRGQKIVTVNDNGKIHQKCENCPQGTFYNSVNFQTCTNCNDKCKEYGISYYCTGTEKDNCFSCHQSCRTCYGPLQSQCLSCNAAASPPLFKFSMFDVCTNFCYDYQYVDYNVNSPTYSHCLECDNNCLACEGSAKHCILCREEMILQTDNTCVKSCTANFQVVTNKWLFFDEGESGYERICENCDGSCRTCESIKTRCTSCFVGKYLKNNQCINSCNTNEWSDTSQQFLWVCRACHGTCRTCSGSDINQCLTCGTVLVKPILAPTTCVVSCAAQQYIANYGSDLVCQQCHELCLNCPGGPNFGTYPVNHNCQLCKKPYVNTQSQLMGGSGICNMYCPPNFRRSDGENTYNCVACPAGCPRCLVDPQLGVKCYKCHDTCGDCYGYYNHECYVCANPRYLQVVTQEMAAAVGATLPKGDYCLETCLDGFYQEITPYNRTCEKCHSTCATCNGPNDYNCITCQGGRHYEWHTGKCLVTCSNDPDWTYLEGISGMCIHCPDQTYKAAEGSCLPCNQKCIDYGIDNFCLDATMATCHLCHENCRSCYGPYRYHCLSCKQTGTLKFRNYVYDECESSCPLHFFHQLNQAIARYTWCLPCASQCYSCVDVATKCTACYSPKLLQLDNTCVDACNSDQYAITATQNEFNCQNCFVGCAKCTGGSNSNCQQCKATYGLLGSTCHQPCPEYYWLNGIVCQGCGNGCASCTNSGATCTKCLQFEGINYFLQSTGAVCQPKCLDGQYQILNAAGNTCGVCSDLCKRCTDSATKCTACKSNYFFKDNTCIPHCPNQFYPDRHWEGSDPTEKACYQCYSGCQKCTGYWSDSCYKCHETCDQCDGWLNSQCVTCQPGLYLHVVTVENAVYKKGDFCISDCPDGFWQNSANGNRTCSACNEACQTCEGGDTSLHCKKCNTGFLLVFHSGECKKVCNPGSPDFTVQNGNKCWHCMAQQYIKIQDPQPICGQCSDKCKSFGIGHFCYDDKDSSCYSCHNECRSCYGPYRTQCLTCHYDKEVPEFKRIDRDECFAGCPSGQFGQSFDDNSQMFTWCRLCNINCKTCFFLATQCTSCKGDMLLQTNNDMCVVACESNQIILTESDVRKCRTCTNNCLTCQTTLDRCLTCGGSYNFYQNTCVLTCPAFFFAKNNVCTDCQLGCAQCTDATTCQRCANYNGNNYHLQLDGKTCQTTCSPGYYRVFEGSGVEGIGTCSKCNILCKTCDGTATTCKSCWPNYNLHANTCVPHCFNTFFSQQVVQNEFVCASCFSGCQKCTDIFANACYKCHETCDQCYGWFNNECFNCVDPYWLLVVPADDTKINYKKGDYCLIECPMGYWESAANGNRTCEKCDISCMSCEGGALSKNCLVCATDYNKEIHTGECQKVCNTGAPDFTIRSGISCVHCNNLQYVASQTACSDCHEWCRGNFTIGAFCYDGNYGSCHNCHSECRTCYGPYRTQCLTCHYDKPIPEFKRHVEDECFPGCPAGQFGYITDPTNNQFTWCNYCSDNCKECVEYWDKCTSCQDNGNGFIYLQTKTNKCRQQCDYDEVMVVDNGLKKCDTCTSNCQTCEGTVSNCLSCKSGFWLFKDSAFLFGQVANGCLSQCPQYFFSEILGKDNLNLDIRVCSKCPPGCYACTSATACTKCFNDPSNIFQQYYLQPNTPSCSTTCPRKGYYGKSGVANIFTKTCNPCSTCEVCHTMCFSCKGPAETDCLGCNTPYKLKYQPTTQSTYGICVPHCGKGYYEFMGNSGAGADDSNFCYKCASSCEICSGPTLNECYKCHESCSNCYGWYAKECISCAAPYFYMYFAPGSPIVGDFCIHCQDGYWGKVSETNRTCEPCHPECYSCTAGEFTKCKQCADNKKELSATNANRCTCKSIYYEVADTARTCADCHSTCLTCNGPAANQCLTCKANTYLNPEQTCVTTCPSSPKIYFRYSPDWTCKQPCPEIGWWGNKAQVANNMQSCDQCHSSCYKCWGARSTHCHECFPTFILTRQHMCHAQCASSLQYFNFDFDNCYLCSDTVAQCNACQQDKISGAVTCSECTANFRLSSDNSKCLLRCTNANTNCDECTGTFANPSCTKCTAGYTLVGANRCAQTSACAVGTTFYRTQANTNTCLNCPRDCSVCSIIQSSTLGTEDQIKTECKICNIGFQVNTDGTCFFTGTSTCPDGCSACSFDSTLRQIVCSACLENYSLSGNVCILNKPNNCLGYYLDPLVKQVKCIDCVFTYMANKDRQCVLLDKVTCLVAQGQRYDVNTGSCVACSTANCDNCIWDDLQAAEHCLFCKSGYILNNDLTCSQSASTTYCPVTNGYYLDNFGSLCLQCPPFSTACAKNSNTGLIEVSACQQNYAVSAGKGACVLSISVGSGGCEVGYISKFSEQLQKHFCVPCATGCMYCQLASDQINEECLACVDTETWFLNNNKKCVSKKCPKQYIFNENFGCELCPFMCSDCKREVTTQKVICIACDAGTGYVIAPATQLCVLDSCPSGQIVFNQVCVACPANCNNCDALNHQEGDQLFCNTDGCASGFVNIQGFCKSGSACPAGQFYGPSFNSENSETLSCQACPNKCSACNYVVSSKLFECTCSTENGQLVDSICQPKTCAAGTTLVYDNFFGWICTSCPTSCTSCFFDNNRFYCSACAEFYQMSDNYCVPIVSLHTNTNCASGLGYDYNQFKCVACPPGCSVCKQSFDASNTPQFLCSECKSSFTWKQGLCYFNCDEGKYAVLSSATSQTCAPCSDSNCQFCFLDLYATAPKLDTCLKCRDTYYLNNGVCKKIPQCALGQFLLLTQDLQQSSIISFTHSCSSCPNGCSECKAQDIYDQFSTVFCIKCTAGFSLIAEALKCIPDLYTSIPTCTETQYFHLKDASTWECVDCPADCAQCSLQNSKAVCTSCAQTKILNAVGQCISLPTCLTRQTVIAFSSDKFECIECPYACTQCHADDLFDENSLRCSACDDGFTLTNFKCSKTYTPGQPVSSTACSVGAYSVVIDAVVKCILCPEGCPECSLANPVDKTSTLTCAKCDAGFTMSAGKCFASCTLSSEYFDVTAGSCQPCDVSCSACSGSGNGNCKTCANLYELNDKKECVAQTTTNLIKDNACPGLETVFSQTAQRCVCLDSTKFLTTSGQCKDIVSFNSECRQGQFFSQITTSCLPCNSNEGKGLCAACTSEQSFDCLACVSGYYLDKKTYKCLPCLSNCALCVSSAVCQRCEAGFSIFSQIIGGVQIDSCTKGCPSGTLPYIPSLTELNANLFTPVQLEQFNAQMVLAAQIDATTTSTQNAVAINTNGQPFFKQLPWTINLGFPYFNGHLINLQCLPCTKNCATCSSDRLLLASKECLKSEFCPAGTVRRVQNSANVCVAPNAGSLEIYSIVIRSLHKTALIQPFSSDLYVEALTTLDSGNTGVTLEYTWEVTSVAYDLTGLKMDFPKLAQQEVTLAEQISIPLIQKFFSKSQKDQKVLKVPKSSLTNYITYQLRVTVKSKSGDVVLQVSQASTSFTVRKLSTTQSINALGVLPDRIKLTKSKDAYGSDYYTTTYELCSSPVVMEDSDSNIDWQFGIEVSSTPEDAVILNSKKCSDSFDFYLPYSSKPSYTVKVIFSAKYGEFVYQTVRKIQVGNSARQLLAPPGSFKAEASAGPEQSAPFNTLVFSKILGQVSGQQLVLSDLATGAATVNAFIQAQKINDNCENQGFILNPDFTFEGSCNNDANVKQCCNLGACTAGVFTAFKCVCIDQQTGIFCNIPKTKMEIANYWARKIMDRFTFAVDTANVQSNIKIVQNLARTETYDLNIILTLLTKLDKLSDYVQDGTVLQEVLTALNLIQQAMLSYAKDNTNKDTYASNQYLINQILVKALRNSIRIISPALQVSTFKVNDLQGQNTFIDVNALSTTTTQSVPNWKNSIIKVTINKSVFKTASNAVLQTLVSNRGSSSLAKGASTLASDNLEINAYDQSTSELIDTSFLDGDCPVQVVLEALPTSSASQTYQCLFYDPSDSIYKQDGCRFVEATRIPQNGNYAVSCCCRHMTKFSVGFSQSVAPGQVAAETSTSEEFADWKIAIIIVIPIGFLILCLILYIVFKKKGDNKNKD